ncbi:MAG: YggT family protein [Pseudomonadota bacterium]|jgi:YggT family protein
MAELAFLIRTVADLIVGAFLLRWLFAIQRTDSRNPLVQSLHRLTNPLILPMRRVIPAIGRTDTATIVALVVVALVRAAALGALYGLGLPSPIILVLGALLALARMLLWIFLGAIFLHALLSWVADPYNPFSRLLADLSDPILRPIRRALPLFGGIDLSPLAAILLLQLALYSLNMRLAPLFFPYDL